MVCNSFTQQAHLPAALEEYQSRHIWHAPTEQKNYVIPRVLEQCASSVSKNLKNPFNIQVNTQVNTLNWMR
jgi:hypothetical protein